VTELINSATGTLNDIWDVIDMLRIDCIQKNESIEYPSKMELDFLEIDKLKKYFWLIQISLMVQTNAQAAEKMVFFVFKFYFIFYSPSMVIRFDKMGFCFRDRLKWK
jgi:hypothetical protein